MSKSNYRCGYCGKLGATEDNLLCPKCRAQLDRNLAGKGETAVLGVVGWLLVAAGLGGLIGWLFSIWK